MGKGTIFLSHASEDKAYVESILAHLDVSTAFYDLNTISPGQESIQSMKDGVGGASVFVLFHSKYTGKVWVEFEKDLAEIQRVRNRALQILIVPVDGETYRTLPEWMKSFMTTTPSFLPRDVVRLINHLSEVALFESQPELGQSYPGREDLERKISLAIRHHPAKTGKPLSVLVLTGLEGMGKATVAKALIRNAYPGMRAGGPSFKLPDAADAIDLHLRLREDIENGLSPTQREEQIAAFNDLTAQQQAEAIVASLCHWSKTNQVITLRSRWGFRDRTHQLPSWLEALLKLLESPYNIRIILLSERKLPLEAVSSFEHVRQYELEELDTNAIHTILDDLIEPRYQVPERIPEITVEIQGHPATARHVAYLVNGGMSIETLTIVPDPIYSFHDRTLEAIFSNSGLTTFQIELLELLSWFPTLSSDVIWDVFKSRSKEDIVRELWQLNSFSLVIHGEGGHYAVPNVIASRFRRTSSPSGLALFPRVADLLKQRFDEGRITVELIDSLIVGAVALKGDLPDFLKGAVTSSALLQVVEQEYNLGLGASWDEASRHFKQAYGLSRLSLTLKSSDDIIENIMFYGADAAVRTGLRPTDLLDYMQRSGFSSYYYVDGSYLFHVKRAYKEAATYLKRALNSKHFRIRTVRLLTRIYLRIGEWSLALETLNRVDDARLRRDTGLMTMKIRALHGIRNHKEARELRKALGNGDNEYGDLATMEAARLFRENKFSEAKEALERAEKAPKSNKVTLRFLSCAIEVESGDNSNLPEVCGLARAAGREADALQLLARAALVVGDWASAEAKLNQIDYKDYFDLEVELRMLNFKIRSSECLADPVLAKKARERKEEVLRLSASSVEGGRF